MDKYIEMLGKIKSKEDFIEFMRLYQLKLTNYIGIYFIGT